jgi:hypothetical protein
MCVCDRIIDTLFIKSGLLTNIMTSLKDVKESIMSSDGITAASPSSLTIAKRNKFVRSPLYGHFIVLVQVMLFTLVQLKYLI